MWLSCPLQLVIELRGVRVGEFTTPVKREIRFNRAGGRTPAVAKAMARHAEKHGIYKNKKVIFSYPPEAEKNLSV